MVYERVQHSTPMRASAVACAVGAAVVMIGGAPVWVPSVLVLVAVVLANASRLTVTVEPSTVTAAFGVGWPRRTIERSSIGDVTVVRNSWWTGWGIRKVRRGWMFNTAGRAAVQLDLRNGSVFRIGSDDPDGLDAALRH